MKAPAHDHRDADRLHFGCPACILRVQRDQFAADIANLELDDLLDIVTAAYVPEWKWQMADDEITRRSMLRSESA